MANLLTAKDVAKKLSISQRKAYSLKSVIGYVQIEGNIRFEVEAVEAYIASCKRSPLPDQHSKWEARVGLQQAQHPVSKSLQQISKRS
ncbi:helix-turn-helix domain-containing protein [Halomonas sp. MS1]|nr:helix-turn-helix domain-containing protein [Halomonas sp. MS1]UTD55471.1 helix-turn-helix domain-containing protein [Halomonas sp. MS1]